MGFRTCLFKESRISLCILQVSPKNKLSFPANGCEKISLKRNGSVPRNQLLKWGKTKGGSKCSKRSSLQTAIY